MDKRIYAILAFLVVGGFGYYLLSPKCEQPDEMTVTLAQLDCVMNVDVPTLRTKACQEIYDESECELQESDLPAVQKILNNVIRECATASLRANNYCTDKYKDLQ